ncbi:MAG: hypothetical protein KGJ37_06940 [Verrucomicrobiota bacterium]|nr:hypothetical protein [Verrucomicrobiota bacterium]
MMTQQAVNGALGVLVEASIKRDATSTMIGAKGLRHATPLQLDYARQYCRIKHGYTDQAIASAITNKPLVPAI